MSLGTGELVIIFLIILVLFGAGRVAQLGGAMGKGIRDFRSAVRDDGDSSQEPNQETKS